MFTILCLLYLCRNREYGGNFQSKTVISKQLSCQMSAQVNSEGRPFWSGQVAQIHSLNYHLPKYRGNVNYYKSVHHPIPTLGNREHLGNFQNKSVNSTFSWVSRYILFLPKLNGKEKPFLDRCKKGDHIARLSLGW